MSWNKKKQFLVTFCAFFVLGASFKVMTLIRGLTEVRPVNAIPIVAGLLFGWVGALGCAFGNVAADLFGTFEPSSILGFVGNFIAAWLPFRMWHVFSEEEPNMHTTRNILLYIFLSAVSGMTVAYVLAFGFEIFWGTWIQTLYLYILYNDAGFAIFLGLPLFIVFTSDSVRMKCADKPASLLPDRLIPMKKPVFVVFTLCMAAMFVGVLGNLSMKSSAWMMGTGIFSAAALVFLLV